MRVAVIGLDCADPRMMFDEFIDQMPNFKRLVDGGTWGELRSCDPPITVPAWQCMATSKNPGKLGFFGFRNRKDFGYQSERIATALDVKEPTIWQLLAESGKRCIILGVPQTYPVKPLKDGVVVSSFLTPGTDSDYTWPKQLKHEIAELVGDYMFDVPDFRTDDKERVLRDIHEMTEKRFDLAEHLVTNREWDLFFMVEMGTDRIHHALWSQHDPTHPRFTGEDHPLRHAVRDYYIRLDERIGAFLDTLPDDTAVIVVSDHGAKSSIGCVCINDWLIQEGYLVMKDEGPSDDVEAPEADVETRERPTAAVRFDMDAVDWSRTTAWGLGGYYGRIYLNVKGREPEGLVEPDEYEQVRDEIKAKLEAMPGPDGKPLGTKAHKPQELYTGPHVDRAPDLFAYFGDLSYRSTQSIGNPSRFTEEAEIGPDEAVHDYNGIFTLTLPNGHPLHSELQGRHTGMTLYDVAPTILHLLDEDVPDDMEGRVLDPTFLKGQ